VDVTDQKRCKLVSVAEFEGQSAGSHVQILSLNEEWVDFDRDSLAILGLSATYILAGAAESPSVRGA
jgi:hypothetical protein